MLPNRPARSIPGGLRRRQLLAAAAAPVIATSGAVRTAWADDRDAHGPRTLVFPRDHGSHPQTAIEWWYITGHTRVGDGASDRVIGFQLTFFRSRIKATQQMTSRFAARQLLFAHAAVTDVREKRFWHDQRIAREGFTVVSASENDTQLRLRNWSLSHADGRYQARIVADDFNLEVDFTSTQAIVLQGDQGWSRKGPQPEQASFYYSRPQLAFQGQISIGKERLQVRGDGARNADPSRRDAGVGAAWLDHEWSDSLLPADAVGWDWIGINLFDGSALTAFQIRDKENNAVWDGGSYRGASNDGAGTPRVFSRGEAVFQSVRGWTSPLTNTTYPVERLLRTPAGQFRVRALLDDQELDSRNSTGAIYWEGLCDLYDSQRRHVGRGYMELTGYAKPLVL